MLSVYFFDPTHLYYELPWLDIPMHILGGIGIAFLVSSVEMYRKKKVSFKYLFIWYMAIALGWELYEIVKDSLRSLPWNSATDTVSDVVNGAVGLYIGYVINKKK